MGQGVALVCIEVYGPGVGFGHGQGELGHALALELVRGGVEKQTGEAAAAMGRVDADLGDVTAIRAHP